MALQQYPQSAGHFVFSQNLAENIQELIQMPIVLYYYAVDLTQATCNRVYQVQNKFDGMIGVQTV